jgi:hypothetical protein
MAFVVFNPRQPLNQLNQALHQKVVKFGFLGGSITESRVPHNWPDFFISRLAQGYTNLKVFLENAALGATGSELGLIRLEEDVICKKPDCVFLEYAVNDWWTPSEDRLAAMEGIIRRLKTAQIHDIVMVYTFSRDMIPYLDLGHLPPTVTDYEKLAQHYQLNSVFVGLDAYQKFKQGAFRFESWLPDGLHPQDFGSQLYGDCVFELIQKVSVLKSKIDPKLPEPFQTYHWQQLKVMSLLDVPFHFPFILKRHTLQVFSPYVLSCRVPNATLIIPFVGTGLLMTFDFGKQSGEIMYRVDQGEWKTTKRDRPNWVGQSGWLRTMKIVDHLPNGQHEIEIKTMSAEAGEPWLSNFDVVFIAQIQ